MANENKIILFHIVPLTRGQKALMKAIHQPLVNRRGIFVYKNYKDFLEDFGRTVKDKEPPLTQQMERALESKHVYENFGLFVLYANPTILTKSAEAIETKKNELKQRKGRFNPELLKSVFTDKEVFIPEEDFKQFVDRVEGPRIINIAELAKTKFGIDINDMEEDQTDSEQLNSDQSNSGDAENISTQKTSNEPTTATKNEPAIRGNKPKLLASQVKNSNIAAQKYLYLSKLMDRFESLKKNSEFVEQMDQLVSLFDKGQKELSDVEYRVYSKLSGNLYKVIQEL